MKRARSHSADASANRNSLSQCRPPSSNGSPPLSPFHGSPPRSPKGDELLAERPKMWDLVLNNDFHLHAGFAALTWVIISVAECYLLFAWEVGVPNATQELDALSWSSEFLDSCSPGFQKWSFARVIVGN